MSKTRTSEGPHFLFRELFNTYNKRTFIQIVFWTQIRKKLTNNVNLIAMENIAVHVSLHHGNKVLNWKLHLRKFFFFKNLSTIPINTIKSHLVTVWFNNTVTCFFGPWRMQGQSGTFVQCIYRTVKLSSFLNWSALEKSQGLLCCGFLYYSLQ